MRICVCGGQGSAYVFPVLSRTSVGFFLKRFFSLRFLCVAVDSMELRGGFRGRREKAIPFVFSSFLPRREPQNKDKCATFYNLLAPTFAQPKLAADCCVHAQTSG